MAQNNGDYVLHDINDISRLFLTTLKKMSERGQNLTFNALTEQLASNLELVSLLELANERRETLTQPLLAEEVQKLKDKLTDKEDERSKMASRLFDAENEIFREKDFYKRLFLALITMARTGENESCIPALDELKELIVEDPPLDDREKALSALRSSIMKADMSVGPAQKEGKSSFLGGFLKLGKQDPLKQAKKAAMQSLTDLRAIIGQDFAHEIDRLHSSIEESDDFDYLISLRKSILDIIARFAEKEEADKDRITGFLQEVGRKLSSLEESLARSQAERQKRLKSDLDFHDDLTDGLNTVRESVNESNTFEDLRSMVLDRLNNLGRVLVKKREEVTIRIEQENNENLQDHFKQVISSLEDRNRVLQEQSSRDPLTGIYNRRVFNERLAAEYERFKRYHTPFSLLFFDIDHFKSVNDTYGHDAGDRALKGIAKSTESVLRKVDVLARYGGEEFVVILFETDHDHAFTAAKKLRALIEETEFDYNNTVVPITISIGVTTAQESDKSAEEILNRADKNLYKAKNAGRNTVVSDESS